MLNRIGILVFSGLIPLLVAAQTNIVRVTCVGASITEGGRTTNPATDAYPVQLGRLLGEGWHVTNCGISRATILRHGDFPYWDQEVFRNALASNPDIVTIYMGSNDSKAENWIYKDEFIQDYSALIDTFRSLPSHPVIYLGLTGPAFKPMYGIRDSILNADIIPMIRQIAEAKGCPIVDFNTLLSSHSDLFPDGIHPNTEGHAIMAQYLYEILTEFTIVVDGSKDIFYQILTGPDNGYLQIRSYAWNDNGKPVNDADLSAKIWTAWDNQWFYLYEEVKDNTLSGDAANVWDDDCIELKIDPQATSEVNSLWDTRLTALDMGSAGVVSADNLGSVEDSQKQWFRKTIAGGYVLEMAIKWSAIKNGSETITPAAGSLFGMAINQQDNDGGAVRRATVQWAAVLLNAAWNTPIYLGTVKFLSGNKLQFIARNNITGVTNLVPYDGSNYTRTGVEEASTTTPKAFTLEQNYPNPFNPSTALSFSVSSPGKIRLEIFDLLGRRIRVLLNETVSPGTHKVRWDGLDESGKSVGSGIYICKVSDGSQSVSKKMLKVQ